MGQETEVEVDDPTAEKPEDLEDLKAQIQGLWADLEP